ncbi:prolipoprotein diacylglyceryl transferase [Caulobacter mirabilis]|uniref:Phosphatidylglycerol--prolipoprotein diacylglyceryl transferase n=1 Tax=Caulobacter mirabilis TaxID=69666 RepID=A0A2D2B1H4_9CAUL|nr:prolipoprotein diacylglyceryl transferase [Caulobacter mirabilis]ATQ44092.1 prolipoprotein diacylglyceryl transferase [Caulobacter mirabilis]
MPFPDFDPVLIHIGPLAIRWYALAYVAGILLGWRYAVRLVKTPRLWGDQKPTATPEQIDDLILWLTLGIIVGGRLGYILFYYTSTLWEAPLSIFKIWEGGMSFHGGLLGVIVAMIFFARANKIDLFKLGDLVAPAVPFGVFFGRIANFINGELWGRQTTAPWGVIFPAGGPYPRHPSQLYEALLEGVLLFVILWFAVHKKLWLQRRGVVAGLFLAGYGLFRLSLEWVREPDRQMPEFLQSFLTMGMLLSLPMLLFGAWMVWRGLKEPIAPAVPEKAEA